MRERILVPLDGSEVGESALAYVDGLLSKLSPEVEREVILLRVLASDSVDVMVKGTLLPDKAATEAKTEQRKNEALGYLDKAGESLVSKRVTVTAKVAVGDPPEQIVKVAEEMDVDLIAMSTHGRSGLSRWAFGNATDKVLRLKGRMPVVVIKASGQH